MSATSSSTVPYVARAFTPVHPDLKDAAGVPAGIANARYVESLARIVYYWGYPAVDTLGRTSAWEVMKDRGPGATMGLFPGAPKNRMGYLDDYMPASQRKVVTPNNDTIYGAGFADLTDDAVVVQTPVDVPAGHYWTIQIVDLFTTVTHQLGSASDTPGGKFLLVGPEWKGRSRKASLMCCVRRPTSPACSAAVSPRTAPSRSNGARGAEPDRHVSAARGHAGRDATSTAKPARATRCFRRASPPR